MSFQKSRTETGKKATRSPALAFEASLDRRLVRKNRKGFRQFLGFVPSIATAIAVEVVIYIAIFMKSDRIDFENLIIACLVISSVPVLSALMLMAFRRQNAPITSAVIVTGIVFSFAISFLSGLRIPMSFVGVGLSIPFVMAIMAYANVRFHRALTASVAVCAFSQQDLLQQILGEEIRIIETPDADIGGIDTLLIDSAVHHREEWSALLMRCYMNGIDVLPWAKFMEIRLGRVDARSLDIAQIAYTPGQILHLRFKRLMDLIFVLVTLPVTLLLAALVAGYIFLRDGSPVIFTQIRCGYGGRPFRMYKFRTMYRDSSGPPTQIGDSRVIPGCRTLRYLRLDEMPQIFNILRGDMTLIGPRPEMPDLSRLYKKETPEYVHRVLLVPGITGWAQVNSGYASNSEETREKLSYDLYYIKHVSLDLDILILFRTIRTILLGVGAR